MRLKDFQIVNKLGAGSFGIVFKAKKKDNGLICVLKEVELSQMDRKMKEWAMNEVTIMKDINSKYIVQYHLSFIENGKLYICMQYCSGGDLSQYLKGQMGKPLNQDIIWKFSLQIMLGIKTLHLKKVLHRDIKTMNIFLAENKQIKIGDLGVARTMTGDFAKTIVGTPYYLSPEMCEEKPYNEKTDVWAMGCLVYQLCTGKHPFEANNQAALAMKIVVGKYPPLPTHYSPLLSWLIKLCLSIDHKRRPTVQYLLCHSDIIKKAKNVGIVLDEESKEVKERENRSKTQENKQANLIIPVKQQQIKVAGQAKLLAKKSSDPKKEQRSAICKKDESKQAERREKSKSKNVKEIKKQVKQVKVTAPQQPKKQIPPKKYRAINQPYKKSQVQEKIKQKKQMVIVQKRNSGQPVQKSKEKPIVSKLPEVMKQKQQHKNQVAVEQSQNNKRRSVQQIVDDDELFRDFGITPEKIISLQDKVQFKKINPINWDGCIANTQELEVIHKLQQNYKTQSGKDMQIYEMGAVEMKQLDDDQQIMAEQINDDDNRPYKSQSQTSDFQDDAFQDSLLLDDLPSEIEEEGQLVRKEKIQMLQRKILENQKRKKELIQLRSQREADILRKIDKAQLQRIKVIVSQGTDEQIQKIASKQLLEYYKIFHYSIEIGRCDETILKCKELIQSMIYFS